MATCFIILGKIGYFSSPYVVISLIEAQCIPILLYGLECIDLTKSMMNSLEHAYTQVFGKPFFSFEIMPILHGTDASGAENCH